MCVQLHGMTALLQLVYAAAVNCCHNVIIHTRYATHATGQTAGNAPRSATESIYGPCLLCAAKISAQSNKVSLGPACRATPMHAYLLVPGPGWAPRVKPERQMKEMEHRSGRSFSGSADDITTNKKADCQQWRRNMRGSEETNTPTTYHQQLHSLFVSLTCSNL